MTHFYAQFPLFSFVYLLLFLHYLLLLICFTVQVNSSKFGYYRCATFMASSAGQCGRGIILLIVQGVCSHFGLV